MTSLIQTYQLPLLIACFLAGCVGTLFLFRMPAGARPWRIADLVWVLLGGFGALTALAAGIYAEDNSRLERQIDIAYAATHAFDRDAARFRLLYCQDAPGGDMLTLCEKVEFLSASTAENAALPLFISVTDQAAPLQGLRLFLGVDRDDMKDMKEIADHFDPAEFLAFEPLDDSTRPALASLRQTTPSVAVDFQVLASAYDDLLDQVGRLKQEWEYLQANAHILIIQVIALCLVAFAAPFRLGKSLKELL